MWSTKDTDTLSQSHNSMANGKKGGQRKRHPDEMLYSEISMARRTDENVFCVVFVAPKNVRNEVENENLCRQPSTYALWRIIFILKRWHEVCPFFRFAFFCAFVHYFCRLRSIRLCMLVGALPLLELTSFLATFQEFSSFHLLSRCTPISDQSHVEITFSLSALCDFQIKSHKIRHLILIIWCSRFGFLRFCRYLL